MYGLLVGYCFHYKKSDLMVLFAFISQSINQSINSFISDNAVHSKTVTERNTDGQTEMSNEHYYT